MSTTSSTFEQTAPLTSVTVPLPAPILTGPCSVESALAARKSIRAFKNEPMGLATLSQLLWAAQGVTRVEDAPQGWNWGPWPGGKRTAPSAGAMYPVELYAVAGKVDGLRPGIYKYNAQKHELLTICPGDRRSQMSTRGPGQKWIEDAPCLFVVSGIQGRLEPRFGDRSTRYLHFEVGHTVENICLQAVALGLGTTVVGSFVDDTVKKIVGIPEGEQPLAIVPVGKAR